nr:hypothetical protein I308_06843 [Cryptococcus tetragattii IND107]
MSADTRSDEFEFSVADGFIMKVSRVGMGENVVGKQLGQIRPLLAELESQYGSHPAEERG